MQTLCLAGAEGKLLYTRQVAAQHAFKVGCMPFFVSSGTSTADPSVQYMQEVQQESLVDLTVFWHAHICPDVSSDEVCCKYMNLQTQHLAQRICHPVSREKIFLSRTCCAQVYWLSGAVSTQFELGNGAATVTAGVAAGVKAGVAAGVKAGEARYGEETPAVADGVGTAGLLDCAGGGGGGGGGVGLLRETAGEV